MLQISVKKFVQVNEELAKCMRTINRKTESSELKNSLRSEF
jgi:hypothetical protein